MGQNIVDLGVETSIGMACLPRVCQNLETTKVVLWKLETSVGPKVKKDKTWITRPIETRFIWATCIIRTPLPLGTGNKSVPKFEHLPVQKWSLKLHGCWEDSLRVNGGFRAEVATSAHKLWVGLQGMHGEGLTVVVFSSLQNKKKKIKIKWNGYEVYQDNYTWSSPGNAK
jgi:hypothetical protein